MEDENKFYFANTTYNALVIVEKITGKIIMHVPFEGYQVDIRCIHRKCVQWQNQIFFLPTAAYCLHVYDIENGQQRSCRFLQQKEKLNRMQEIWGSWEYFFWNDHMYLLPWEGRQGLWLLITSTSEPSREEWWTLPLDCGILRHGKINEECFYSLEFNSNRLYITNITKQVVESVLLPDKHVQHIVYDGRNFWYTVIGASDIVCWNLKSGTIDRYSVPYDKYYLFGSLYGTTTYTYRDICFASGQLFLLSGDGTILYVLDRKTGKLRVLHIIKCSRGAFNADELFAHFKRKGNLLLCMLQDASEMLVIDLNTMEVRQIQEIFQADYPIKEVVYGNSYKLLLERNALLFEESSTADLNLLLQYCIEN